MENILLIGHGSPKKDANTIELVGKRLHAAVHPGCADNCVHVAYLQFAEPDIEDAIKGCVDNGATRIIIHPYFLSAGMHVTKDIPEIIKNSECLYPGVEFVYTEPLGSHEKLVQVIIDRIRASGVLLPEEIENKSFEMLTDEADFSGVDPQLHPIVKRVIHATADFEFRDTLVFHPEAVNAGLRAIAAGKSILTDVEMVRAGINKKLLGKWGGNVICAISDEEVDRLSKETGATRAEISIERNLNEDVGIIAIGNAPTALLKVIDLLNKRAMKEPPLVVGVPVGFVKAYESKALLAAQQFPFITNLSRKGGTPVAVAIVNALLKMASEES